MYNFSCVGLVSKIKTLVNLEVFIWRYYHILEQMYVTPLSQPDRQVRPTMISTRLILDNT